MFNWSLKVAVKNVCERNSLLLIGHQINRIFFKNLQNNMIDVAIHGWVNP